MGQEGHRLLGVLRPVRAPVDRRFNQMPIRHIRKRLAAGDQRAPRYSHILGTRGPGTPAPARAAAASSVTRSGAKCVRWGRDLTAALARHSAKDTVSPLLGCLGWRIDASSSRGKTLGVFPRRGTPTTLAP